MNTEEINGFLIDEFNQHSLKKVHHRGFVPCVHLIDNLRIRKHNVLLTIGNVVLVPVTIVIHHFNYILINVKELVKRFTLDLKRFINHHLVLILKVLKNGLKKEVYQNKQ